MSRIYIVLMMLTLAVQMPFVSANTWNFEPVGTVLGKDLVSKIKQQPNYKQRMRKALFAQYRKQIDESRSGHLTQYDIIKLTGKDPIKIFEWVRQNTVLVPYDGILRGNKGLLIDRSGNSLERSNLLKILLQSAGIKSRLVYTEIESGQWLKIHSGQVGKSMNFLKSYYSLAADKKKALAEVKELTGLTDADLTGVIDTIESHKQKTVDKIDTIIDRLANRLAKIVQTGKPASSPSAAGKKKYWWVQFEKTGQWIDLDLAQDKPGDTSIKADKPVVVNLLKDDLYHKITINLKLKVTEAGKTESHNLVSHKLRVADLGDKQIKIRHYPVGWTKKQDDLMSKEGSRKQFRDLMLKLKEWVPVLEVGERSKFERYFSTGGLVFDSADFHPNTTKLGKGIQKQTQRKVGNAMDLFSSLPTGTKPAPRPARKKPQDKTVFTMVEEVEFIVHMPGKPDKQFVRKLFEYKKAVKPSQLDDYNLRLKMMSDLRILIYPFKYTRQYVKTQNSKAVLSYNQVIKKLIAAKNKIPNDNTKIIVGLNNFDLGLYELAVSRFAFNKQHTQYFISEPNIYSFQISRQQTKDDKVVEQKQYDIINNRYEYLPGVNFELAGKLRQGVSDTVSEALILTQGKTVVNAAFIMDTRLSKHDDWIVVKNKAELDAYTKQNPAMVLPAIQDSVAKGRWAVVPGKPQSGNQVWWAYSPVDQNILGMDANGKGSAFWEYIATETNKSNVEISRWRTFGCLLANKGAMAVTVVKRMNDSDFNVTREVARLAVKQVACLFAAGAFGLADKASTVYRVGSVIGGINLVEGIGTFVYRNHEAILDFLADVPVM